MASHSKKTLNFKVSLFFFAISATLIAVLTAISLFAFRQFSISTATEHLRTAAEIARVHLTEAMITGVIDQRQSFLLRLAEVQNLKTARVVRSPLVDEQFGTARKGEYLPDELEKAVLKTGEPKFEVSEKNGEIIFRGTIPYAANREGSPNCLQCHLAQPGDVLGAVTMTMSITAMRHNGVVTVASIIGVVVLAVVVLFILLYYLLRPISDTASAIEHAVQDAINGNFKNEVEQKTNDEIGQIASDMNRLLRFLDEGLNKIDGYISRLVTRKRETGENLLLATIDMVESMTHISQYKIAIDEDKSKFDVYRRLIGTINKRFFHDRGEFSIYEVSSENNELQPIAIDGITDDSCRWCDKRILAEPGACRIIYTSRMIDGISQPDICQQFRQDSDGEACYPLCFPIIKSNVTGNSGVVGSIVQLVVRESDKARIQTVLPYIEVYMADTAPVLEVRRLLETLRDSSLRDPMTGLNNRRFLEEYVDTLTANVRRKQTSMAILMLDLDHFKMVNDTYGHDTGDAVLKALANVIKNKVRASDIVIRYGGEEFMVVLQDISDSDSLVIAEKIRASVEAMVITHNGTILQKTISIGVANFPKDSNTFWQAVKFADVALYHAKSAGRNRVQHFTPDMWTDNKEY
ncbi:MAG: GGDEF domain-containing protein [Azoarcus sp.]|jgi:diguanylate cyclase (GGDEF)-like protein|nr:GGDEF domain-containing protein [Azoarcus sp.]